MRAECHWFGGGAVVDGRGIGVGDEERGASHLGRTLGSGSGPG